MVLWVGGGGERKNLSGIFTSVSIQILLQTHTQLEVSPPNYMKLSENTLADSADKWLADHMRNPTNTLSEGGNQNDYI